MPRSPLFYISVLTCSQLDCDFSLATLQVHRHQ